MENTDVAGNVSKTRYLVPNLKLWFKIRDKPEFTNIIWKMMIYHSSTFVYIASLNSLFNPIQFHLKPCINCTVYINGILVALDPLYSWATSKSCFSITNA